RRALPGAARKRLPKKIRWKVVMAPEAPDFPSSRTFPLATRAHPQERIIVASSPRRALPGAARKRLPKKIRWKVVMAPEAPDFPLSRTSLWPLGQTPGSAIVAAGLSESVSRGRQVHGGRGAAHRRGGRDSRGGAPRGRAVGENLER